MNTPKIGVVGFPGNAPTEALVRTVGKKTGFRCLVDMENVCLDLDRGRVMFGNLDLSSLDALIIKKIGSEYSPDLLGRLQILDDLQKKGVRCFSKPDRIIKLLDRLGCTTQLSAGGIPIPPTLVTESVQTAADAVNRFGKAVLKPLYTSKARGMRVLEAGNGILREIENYKAEGNRIIYVQRMVPLPGQDLGITFLGGRYLATYARVGHKTSWNTTTHSGGRYRPYTPTDDLIELARKAQALFDLDFTCVDLVETPDGPKVFEVSAFGGYRGLQEAHNI
ncbi:MAG: ATP-grasp family protein, partial [Nitrospinae bacterium CG11_big_fil_rev_8_21_14_0_20_56_8]